ncbi:MAG: aminoglycoside phosphotransferase family protein [Caldilineaceae bacterium]|nr:aminoglycoside phosphotransferase family protein [Caldilineaceae bacterium]
MLEKPDLDEAQISACLQEHYGLALAQVTFLPLGADSNTAVYRAVTATGTAYFVKLRRGTFQELMVTLPKWLSAQGIAQIIPPLATQQGTLYARLDSFAVILYPFVEGKNGYEVALSPDHWRTFGAALKRIHTVPVPAALRQQLPTEQYSPKARTMIRDFLVQIEHETYADPIASQLAVFLRTKAAAIHDLVNRAERLAAQLQNRPRALTVCHTDLHAGNLLIDTTGTLYIVDWDEPLLAAKERDLMFAGGGLGGAWHTPAEEERSFYEGYGLTEIDAVALAYYRYERIIQDIAIYCEELLLSTAGGADRAQSFYYLTSNFFPNGLIDIAYQTDQTQG